MPSPVFLDPAAPPTSLQAILEAIYQRRYTGQVLLVLHCQNGVAQEADIGRPVAITDQCQRVSFRPPRP